MERMVDFSSQTHPAFPTGVQWKPAWDTESSEWARASAGEPAGSFSGLRAIASRASRSRSSHINAGESGGFMATQVGPITLRASNGKYVCAEGGGGRELVANRDTAGPWETFTHWDLGNGQAALQAANGQYVCAENGGGREVVANRGALGPWETFQLTDRGGGNLALQAANGMYVCAEGGGGREVVANRTAIGPWETFSTIQSIPLSPAGYGPGRNLPIRDNYVAFDVPVGAAVVMTVSFPADKEVAILVYPKDALQMQGPLVAAYIERGNYSRSADEWTFRNDDAGIVLPLIATGWWKNGPPDGTKPWIEAIQVVGGGTGPGPGSIGWVVDGEFRDLPLTPVARVHIAIVP
jgi:hypothetical protein